MSEDVGFSIDFGALKQQASDMLDKVVETPEPVAAVPPPAAAPEPTPTTPTLPEPVAPPVAPPTPEPPSPLTLADDALVTITIDGEERQVPWKDARSNISGGMKFTRNMQQLASDRRAFEAERAQISTLVAERDQLRSLLQSPLLQTLAQQQTATPAAPALDPAAIATVGDTQALVEQNMQALTAKLSEVQRGMEKTIETREAALALRQETAAHAVVVQSTLAEIFAANPVLKSIPNAEDLIRFNVVKMEPASQAEAVEALKTVARGIVDDIGKHYKQTEVVQKIAAAKQKLTTATIEPAGGSAPQLAPVNHHNADGSLNWKSVTQAAQNYTA